MVEKVDKMLAEDIPRIMQMIPQEEQESRKEDKGLVKGGAFDKVMDSATPFMYKGGEGINAGVGEVEWVVSKDQVISQKLYSIFLLTLNEKRFDFDREIIRINNYFSRSSMMQSSIAWVP